MEKRGVIEGEGEAPKPTEKKADDKNTTPIGGDLLSRMSQSSAEGVKRGEGPLPPKK